MRYSPELKFFDLILPMLRVGILRAVAMSTEVLLAPNRPVH